jgi:SAM-dependent methyltransferase
MSNRKKRALSADKHELYQASVQGVDFELDYVEKVFRDTRGRRPTMLREDFCGTALSACEWVKRNRNNRAVGVDLDADVLDWGRRNNLNNLGKAAQRISLLQEDVRKVKVPAVDMCVAFNFSYWIFRERKVLKQYFRNVYRSLVDDGVFFLDVFGGYEAHRTQKERRKLDGFTYVWEQAEYNPIGADMLCHIHFEFPDGSKLKKAFSYRWRLWGAQEIRDLLHEAGFKKTTVHIQAFDEDTDEPLDEFYPTEVAEDYASWIGYIVAEK